MLCIVHLGQTHGADPGALLVLVVINGGPKVVFQLDKTKFQFTDLPGQTL